MENILVVDYSVKIIRPAGLPASTPLDTRRSFNFGDFQLLPLRSNKIEDIWQLRRGAPWNTYLSEMMALALAIRSQEMLFWEKYDQIFCADNKILADEEENGQGRWSLALLKREPGQQVFKIDYVSHDRLVENIERSCIAMIPGQHYSLGSNRNG